MKTIYFTAGPVPTPQEITDAAAISGEVVLRNAEYVGTTDAIELCDAVAGAVPQIYIDYFKKPDGYFVDAPEDGQTYGRKDAAWDEVTSGGGGGGGLNPEYPAYYLNSILYALPGGGCAWGPVPDIGTVASMPEEEPYELLTIARSIVDLAYPASGSGTTKFTQLLEVSQAGIFVINKKVYFVDIVASDYLTEQFRHAYTLKVFQSGDDVSSKHVSFERYSVSNAAIQTFLNGFADPEAITEYSSDTLALLNLNPGKYLIELEVSANNRSQFYGRVEFTATELGGGQGSIFTTSMNDFTIRHKDLMPIP